MSKFEVVLAFNVPCYATVAVEASTQADAIQQALQQARVVAFKPEWDLADPERDVDSEGDENYRVVDVNEVSDEAA